MKKNNLKLLTIIILLKLIGVGLLLFFHISSKSDDLIGIAAYAGDSDSYIEPIENYISNGHFTYSTDAPNLYRTPYYGSFYYLFRLFSSKFISLQILVIFQIVMEIIGLYLFSKVVFSFLKERWAKILFLIMLGVSLYHSDYAFRILSESLSLSFLLISFYFVKEFINNKRTKYLVLSGVCFAIVVLLKPYFVLFYLMFGVTFILVFKEGPIINRLKKVFVCSFLFFIPFLILDSPWIYRNYKTFGIFEPFNRYEFGEVEWSFRRFVQARGESFIWWDHETAGCYFKVTDQPCNFVISENFISENSSIAETESIQSRYYQYQLAEVKSNLEAKEIVKEFDRLTENYKLDKPFNFYFLSRMRITSLFLFNSGSFYLPFHYAESNLVLKLIKLSQTFIYYMCVILGIVGLLFLTSRYKLFFILFITPLFLILFFPIIVGATEWRFFFHFFPFAVMGLVYFIEASFNLVKSMTD